MGIKVPGPPPATDDQGGILGTLLDWAARLNAGLNPVNAAQAASKTVPGIVRFATDAEATAATIDTVTLTPKQALAQARANPLSFPTLAALFAATAAEGTVAAVARYAFSSGILHRESVWHMVNGQWHPVGAEVLVEASDAVGGLSALNSISSAVSSSSSTAYLAPGTKGILANTGQEWRWNGAAWKVSHAIGAFSYTGPGSEFTNLHSTIQREGNIVSFALNASFSSQSVNGAQFATLPSDFLPLDAATFGGAIWTSAAWVGLAGIQFNPNGAVTFGWGTQAVPAGGAVFVAGSYPAVG